MEDKREIVITDSDKSKVRSLAIQNQNVIKNLAVMTDSEF